MIDFKENIELLEKVILNFILMPDDNETLIRPKNVETLDKREIIPKIKSQYFNSEDLASIFKVVKSYFKEYSKIPSKSEIRELLNLDGNEMSDAKFDTLLGVNLAEYNYEFLSKYTKSFILIKNLNSSIVDILSFLKTSEINPENVNVITDQVRNKLNTNLNVSFSNAESGLNFFKSDDHIQVCKTGTPTGFQFFDKTLGGGWNPKTLVVFQGRPKVGKSMVLSNIAARAFMSGVNTGVATLELADSKYMKRLGSNILNIPYNQYNEIISKDRTAMVSAKIERLRQAGSAPGELWVKEFPTGNATAIDIENYFLKVQETTGKKMQVIVVDYINLMRPMREQGNIYEKIKVISEELRAVAQRNDWTVITATQIKRDAVEDQDLGMQDVAESFGLVHTVDSLYGLMRGPMEKRIKIKVIANRDEGYTESFKMYRMYYDYSRLVEETDPASEYYSDDDDISSIEDDLRQQYAQVQNKPAITVTSVVKTTGSHEDILGDL
jgi:KaiC/GvpD/RAD55 family RecA-like ATPase